MKKVTMVLWIVCAMYITASPALSQDVEVGGSVGQCPAKLANCDSGKQACEADLGSCIDYLNACWAVCPTASSSYKGDIEGVSAPTKPKKEKVVADDKPVKHKEECDDRCECRKKGGWYVKHDGDADLPWDIEAGMDGHCLTLVQVHEFAWKSADKIDDLAAAIEGLESLMGKCCAAKVEESEIHYDYSYSAPTSSCECGVKPADLDILRKELSAFRARFQEIVNDLQAQLADKASQGDLDALSAEVKALKARLDGLDKRLAKVEKRLDELEARIADLEARVDALEDKDVEQDEAIKDLQKAKARTHGLGPGLLVNGIVNFKGDAWIGLVTTWTLLHHESDKATVEFNAELGPVFGVTDGETDELSGVQAGGSFKIFPGNQHIIAIVLGFKYMRTGLHEIYFRGQPDPQRDDYMPMAGLALGKEWRIHKEKVDILFNLFGRVMIGADCYKYNVNPEPEPGESSTGVTGTTGVADVGIGIELILEF